MINISELVDDPDFAQPQGINFTRTVMEIQNHVPVEITQEMNVRGIITISNENEDDMLSEADVNKESIRIVTYERLKTDGVDKNTGVQHLADIVHFRGADYIVRICLDDEQYGFCRSIAVKMDVRRM